MLPCMNTDLVSSLSERRIYSVQELLDIPRAALQTITGNFPASKLYQVRGLTSFPCFYACLRLLLFANVKAFFFPPFRGEMSK